MANQIANLPESPDDLIRQLIRSDGPDRAPKGFTGNVMSKLGELQTSRRLKPVKSWSWLSWAVPGLMAASVLVAWAVSLPSNRAVTGEDTLTVSQAFDGLDSLLSSWTLWTRDLFHSIPVGGYWIMAGIMVLAWGFLLLWWFLERLDRNRSKKDSFGRQPV